VEQPFKRFKLHEFRRTILRVELGGAEMSKEEQHVPIDKAVLDNLALRVLALADVPVDKRRKRRAFKDLRARIDGTLVDTIESLSNDPDAQTRLLRSSIATYLTGSSASSKSKSEIAVWIVSNWGSVTQGQETLSDWVDELGTFQASAIDSFRKRLVHRRMSSWTKILSFANHQTYPIYDANNAIALNILMEPLSTANFFYMPTGQNMFVAAARKKLNDKYKLERGKYPDLGGYEDYSYLIERVVSLGRLRDALDAEQLLFNRSVGVAQRYLTTAEQAEARAKAKEKAEKSKRATERNAEA
jgi:hypothetical protein